MLLCFQLLSKLLDIVLGLTTLGQVRIISIQNQLGGTTVDFKCSDATVGYLIDGPDTARQSFTVDGEATRYRAMSDRDVTDTTFTRIVETSQLLLVLLGAVVTLTVGLWEIDKVFVRLEVLEGHILKVLLGILSLGLCFYQEFAKWCSTREEFILHPLGQEVVDIYLIDTGRFSDDCGCLHASKERTALQHYVLDVSLLQLLKEVKASETGLFHALLGQRRVPLQFNS